MEGLSSQFHLRGMDLSRLHFQQREIRLFISSGMAEAEHGEARGNRTQLQTMAGFALAKHNSPQNED